MSTIFRIYQGTTLTEQELANDGAFSLGSGKKDTLCLENYGLGKSHLAFTRTGEGWSWQATAPVLSHGKQSLSGTVEAGELLVVDRERKLAVTVIRRDQNDTRIIDLNGRSSVTLGRSGECDIVIGSRQVSGKHLQLRKTAQGWTACDLGSSNGVYCNGQLTRERQLQSGDVLDLGPCRILLTGDSLSVNFHGSVKSNLVRAAEAKTANSPEEEYPHKFHRSPRLLEDIPTKVVELQDAPGIGAKPTIRWGSVIIPPIAGLVIMAAAMYFMGGSPKSLMFSAPMTLIGVIMSVVNYRGQSKDYGNMEQLRLEKYDNYLQEKEDEAIRLLNEQRRILTTAHPATADCLPIVAKPERRLWERRRDDRDFLQLRVGEGEVPACVSFRTPNHGLTLVEDDQAGRAGELARRYETLPHAPILCGLAEVPTCGVIGPRESCLTVVRNMLMQAAVHHSYEDLRIVLLCSKEELPQWAFMKWLPHVYDDTRSCRYIADDPTAARSLLNNLTEVLKQRTPEEGQRKPAAPSGPHYLFICADESLLEGQSIRQYLTANDPALGVSAVFLYDTMHRLPKECLQILEMKGSKGVLYHRESAGSRVEFTLDPVRKELYEELARTMAPIRIELAAGKGHLPTSVSFLQGYGARQPRELRQVERWAQARPETSMAVPIGLRSNGEPFRFDIHEKQYGPHGLVAGMTGSGKSEMVQSWILSMALAFPPEAVSFVLIDFKGTGLILPFRNLPHLAGTISDLDTNITRNLVALENELNRRKTLLDQAGVSNISAYLKLYRQGKVSEPLSYLFLVIDEFAEFKLQFPDFMQVVNRVFAIGRTLGVHILLLTQKPGSVVDDKMNANTRFRWCLKVASSADSQEMLRHPDAVRITNPGRAYVQVGEDEVYEEIQSYWSGAPFDPMRDLTRQRSEKIAVVDLYGQRRSYVPEKTTGFRSEKNEIDVIVDYLDGHTRKAGIPRARNIWTNKLDASIELSQLLHIAFDGEKWSKNEGFAPVVGVLDDPAAQTQYPLRLDLPEMGHTMIYGAPGTGKTTFLQTFIMSAALSYSPAEVSMYLLDFGGGSLNLFRELPHVGDVARDSEGEHIDKICKLITDELTRRKDAFARLGLVNLDSYREISGETLPYMVLVVDQFGPMLNLYPQLSDFFQTLTREGGAYGIYLVGTAVSESAVTYRISQNLKGGIALRMPDRSDYASIVGRTNGLEPENLPGRGLFPGKPPLEFQTALPASGGSEKQRVGSIRTLVNLMNDKWDGARPEGVPMMPEHVLARDWKTDGFLAGLDVTSVKPVQINLKKQQFLLLSATGGRQGKATLQALAEQCSGRFAKDAAVFYDPAERLLEKYRDNAGEYLTSAEAFDRYIAGLMPVLQKRKEAAETEEGRQWLAEQDDILIVISDLKRCFDAVSNETMRRLSNIVVLGGGLRVCLVVLTSAEDRENLYHSGDAFTVNLSGKSAVLMTEGSFRAHGTFTSQLDYVAANEPLAEGEGWLLTDGVAQRIKCVEPEL